MGAIPPWLSARTHGQEANDEMCLAALWLHQSHNRINTDLLLKLLASEKFQIRAAAFRVLSFWSDRLPNTLELLRPRIADDHPRVRLEAIRACSFLANADAAAEAALNALESDIDPWIEYTLEETLRGLGR
jgi:HEAT repeat protein